MGKRAIINIFLGVLTFSACAEASDLVLNLSGTFSDGSQLSGTLSFDGVTFDAVDWRVTGKTNLEFTKITEIIAREGSLDREVDLDSQDGSASLFLDFAPITFLPFGPDDPDIDPNSTLLGYKGGPLCSLDQHDGCLPDAIVFNSTNDTLWLTDGTAATTTPEPVSVPFLLLGLVAVLAKTKVRRRL